MSCLEIPRRWTHTEIPALCSLCLLQVSVSVAYQKPHFFLKCTQHQWGSGTLGEMRGAWPGWWGGPVKLWVQYGAADGCSSSTSHSSWVEPHLIPVLQGETEAQRWGIICLSHNDVLWSGFKPRLLEPVLGESDYCPISSPAGLWDSSFWCHLVPLPLEFCSNPNPIGNWANTIKQGFLVLLNAWALESDGEYISNTD